MPNGGPLQRPLWIMTIYRFDKRLVPSGSALTTGIALVAPASTIQADRSGILGFAVLGRPLLGKDSSPRVAALQSCALRAAPSRLPLLGSP